ncbi:MAG TPA: mechanosensitive ion channel domain-containing protein, partial [Pararhizobium sp.]|uniref:mechanosensitive ion channel family protein n=1 Tax=Pararhizobium sp. TaxID=1977563 RepID=UPI002C47F7B7
MKNRVPLIITPIVLAASATLANAEVPSGDIAGMTLTLLDQLSARSDAIAASFTAAPLEWQTTREAFSAAMLSGDGVRTFTYVLLLLTIGVGLEWFYWTYGYASLRVLLNVEPASPRQSLLFGLRRFWLAGFGLLLFAVAAIGSTSAFVWPPGVHDIVVTVTLAIVTFRLTVIVANIVLSPGVPQIRLVPLPDRTALIMMAGITLLAAVGSIAWFVPSLITRIASEPNLAEALRIGLGTLITTALLAACLLLLRGREKILAERRRGVLPKFPRALASATLVVIIYGLWLFGNSAAAIILTTIAVVIALQISLRAMVFYFWRDRAIAEEIAAEALDGEEHDAPADPELAPSIILPAVRLVVVLTGLAVCALALDMPFTGMATSESPLARFGFRLLGVAALALLANVAWITVRTTIDYRLATIDKVDEHEQPGPGARLLTLLPILRTTAATVITVLLVLSGLWTLGLEITPLLAGAGVVGLAFGFGAQSLVQDVITGIFYLAEDTFRVGEYIESGSSTKGTVEKLTLRTVALRHHNGPLHFVPYGTLGTVRNTSRDWVVEKFNLPLPVEVDSEKVRKLIKRVGEDMMADEELGPLIQQPLKGKLYRVEPGIKIFRCNFRTAPGNQFTVRAAAYKRIEVAMNAAGIAYAGNVPVTRTLE